MPSAVKPFKVANVDLGSGQLFLIAGPCVVESEAHTLKMAEAISTLAGRFDVPYIFKASYDKANRTSASAYRGPGIDEALRVLGRVRNDLGLPVLTDVHGVSQVQGAAEVADVRQIPTFLSRQNRPDHRGTRSGQAVNKKGSSCRTT
jgi:2-dehydro-3-deoxyphosphooctonate aldolase (KDO 8-P synthase)